MTERSFVAHNPRPTAHPLCRCTIGVIGAGNMGAAIIRGLHEPVCAGIVIPASRLLVRDTNSRAIARLRGQAQPVRHITALAAASDVILLAVKPQDLKPVLHELRESLARQARRPLIISIAAGVQTRSLERSLGRVPVVRVMPNLAATVGAAMSAFARGRWATRAHLSLAEAIFASVGAVVEVPEQLFDIVTAISGSGPAYFFLVFQALQAAGMRGGLDRETARALALQTAQGSVTLSNALNEGFDALIARVASKQGTTEAALKVFARRRLADILREGVAAAAKRSKELSEW